MRWPIRSAVEQRSINWWRIAWDETYLPLHRPVSRRRAADRAMTAGSTWFQRYLLPGFVFQAAVIAGGYATGRELVEFFLPAGPWGGLLGMVVSMLVWSAVLAISFELARRARAYEYRSFFKLLLGRGWFLFEIAYF